KEIAVKEGFIDAAAFDAIAEEAARLKQNVGEVLVSKNIVAEGYLFQILSRYFNIPLADLSLKSIDETALHLLPESLARQRRVIIFGREADGSLSAAMENPSDLEAIEFLGQYLSAKIRPYLAIDSDLKKGFALYGQKQSEDFKKLIEDNINESLRIGKRGEEAAADVPIVAIVDNIIAYAVNLRASDIHLEIFEDGILVRYRVDGILHEMMKVPKAVHAAIIARIKLLAALKMDEHYKPQDGRIRYKIGPDVLDIRVAVIPTFYGEKITMRLLTAAQRPLALQEIGMLEDTVAIVEENIKKSYGMILVVGPTGSGKTTTLYSILNILNRPEVNIVTIEDPIEYNIKYINQTQINPAAGITFATGLRSILRQDPNIVLVGEIRDDETASIAVQASLTGHLVLSSLHTNDAPTTVPRLMDMNIPPFLEAAVLNLIIAQRLVRKVCMECIYSLPPQESEIASLKKQMDELGVGESFKPPKFVYKGKGCPSCGNTGYRGRIGIFETLNVTEEIRKIIVSPNLSLDEMKRVARQQGMISMFEDGLRKVEKGLTTVEELLRVIKE
ncbi:MAG: GspE/PulE family protein, partial [Candidatus Colwellbacteria bacterium]|nr:GspE/PulE family protein [Candidatus Colwellbacteria bacterium]